MKQDEQKDPRNGGVISLFLEALKKEEEEGALPTDAIIALLARNLFHLALTHHPPTSSVIDHHFSPGDQRLHVSTFHPRSLRAMENLSS